tara:strand:- start:720 stop:938 length:219 start_codon:yes stop_codon:yes gene_type:complete
MFKHLKQDKKSLKTFKKHKSLNNPCECETGCLKDANGKSKMSEHTAEYATKKKPKKRMPKDKDVFGTKPSKK